VWVRLPDIYACGKEVKLVTSFAAEGKVQSSPAQGSGPVMARESESVNRKPDGLFVATAISGQDPSQFVSQRRSLPIAGDCHEDVVVASHLRRNFF